MKQLHQKIKLLREEKGWSLREIATKIPMSHTAYRKIEDGFTHPTWDRILKLSEIYKIKPEELVGSTDNVTRDEQLRQQSIDEVFDILYGMNLELFFIRQEIQSIRQSTNRMPPKSV